MSYSSDDPADFSLLWHSLLLFSFAILLATACSRSDPADPSTDTTVIEAIESAIEQPTDIPTPPPDTATPSPTPIPPTPTPPLAAMVNGEMITKAEFEADLAQYAEEMTALGETLPLNYEADRLNYLIEGAIFRQAATEWGVMVDDATFQTALEGVMAEAEANGGYEAWLRANQYTADEFEAILKEQLVASAVIEQVVRTVPATIEQVRARYIVVNDGALAQSIVDQVRSGSSFADLAVQNSLDQTTAPNGGDLGFIMRGWLFRPEIEELIFTLEPGQTSEVTPISVSDEQTSYYIVQVEVKDPARPLSTAQRDVMTKRVIEEWLGERLATADIQTFE